MSDYERRHELLRAVLAAAKRAHRARVASEVAAVELEHAVVAAREGGLPLRRVAQHAGVSHETVRRICQRRVTSTTE